MITGHSLAYGYIRLLFDHDKIVVKEACAGEFNQAGIQHREFTFMVEIAPELETNNLVQEWLSRCDDVSRGYTERLSNG